jgi:glycosyltransferase involved in cell wall biosynthesis
VNNYVADFINQESTTHFRRMIIVVNTISFFTSAGNDFFYDYCVKTAIAQPEQQFIFIMNGSLDEQLNRLPNAVQVVSVPRGNNPFMWKLWLNYTLPKIAKKYKADQIINIAGICSLRTKLPQYLFISDVSFLQFPAFFSKNQQAYFKNNLPVFLSNANKIITASNYLSEEIIKLYSIDATKVITFPLKENYQFKTINWREKDAVKEKYAERKEFFLFTGEIHPKNCLVNLLKAFSFFKERQKSNMQLLIIAKGIAANDRFLQSVKSYKYRSEVKILLDLPETEAAKITAATYAFVYPSLYDGIAMFAFEAMQCGVPVITSRAGAMEEIAGNAALYLEPENFEDIAQKMMLIFKDETFRNKLIENGKLRVEQLRSENMNDPVWESILNSPKQVAP